jgi:hypothetical protein
MSDTRTYYAKVENNTVTAVHVVTWDFLVANPERYGDSNLWLQVFPDNSGRGYCAVGDLYDSVNDVFYSPIREVME